MNIKMFFALVVIVTITICAAPPGPSPRKVVIGYIAGFRGLRGLDTLHAKQMTHINYAFAEVRDNRVFLPRIGTDTINLRNLHELTLANKPLKALVSIGGWAGSRNFSDAALTDSSRRNFAASAVDLIRQFDLDGIDIDWEYPGMIGAGNIYRPEDKHNFTLMMKALRDELDVLGAQKKHHLLLTIAAGADTSFLLHTEMKEVQKYLDYVNLMTYDFKTESDSIAGHHTNLYTTKADPDESSSDRSVRIYMNAGVPASKIVQGVAFYGRAWKVNSPQHNGLNTASISYARGAGFSRLKDSLLTNPDYKRYWDADSKAPYLFNSKDSTFISYDDEESIREKCLYVKRKNLAGVMFWEYYSDYKGYLLDVIDKEFKAPAHAGKK